MQSQTWRRLGRMMSCVESALSPQNDTSCRSDRFPAGPRRFPARPRACPRSAPPRGRDRARRRAVGVLERHRGAGAAGGAGRARLRRRAGRPGRGDGPGPSRAGAATRFASHQSSAEQAVEAPEQRALADPDVGVELEVHRPDSRSPNCWTTSSCIFRAVDETCGNCRRLRRRRRRPNPLRPEVAVNAFVCCSGRKTHRRAARWSFSSSQAPAQVLGELYEGNAISTSPRSPASPPRRGGSRCGRPAPHPDQQEGWVPDGGPPQARVAVVARAIRRRPCRRAARRRWARALTARPRTRAGTPPRVAGGRAGAPTRPPRDEAVAEPAAGCALPRRSRPAARAAGCTSRRGSGPSRG